MRRRFRGRFRHPPGTLRGPKPLKTLGGLIKIEGRRFRAREAPGSILGAKMEPKLEPETKKNRCKNQCKNRLRKALKFVDIVIVGISDGNQKNFLFSIDERVKIVQKAIFKDLKFSTVSYPLSILVTLSVFAKTFKIVILIFSNFFKAEEL